MRVIFKVLVSCIILSGCSTASLNPKINTEQVAVRPNNYSNSVIRLDLPERINGETVQCRHSASAFNCVRVVDVYDGDTIFIDIPGNHPLFGKRMGVRIYGIDTPELKTKDGCEKKRAVEAKAFLESMLFTASRVDVMNVEKDKYFRVLGAVIADGRSVSDELVKRGFAYPYFGEKKPHRNWCDR